MDPSDRGEGETKISSGGSKLRKDRIFHHTKRDCTCSPFFLRILDFDQPMLLPGSLGPQRDDRIFLGRRSGRDQPADHSQYRSDDDERDRCLRLQNSCDVVDLCDLVDYIVDREQQQPCDNNADNAREQTDDACLRVENVIMPIMIEDTTSEIETKAMST